MYNYSNRSISLQLSKHSIKKRECRDSNLALLYNNILQSTWSAETIQGLPLLVPW